MGYHRAGFDEIVGIDIVPQKNYPFTFIQADALKPPVRLEDFDLIHASPPCQDHSAARTFPGVKVHGTGWMLEASLNRLGDSGVPWIVENVEGARRSMGDQWVTLCGSVFGLEVRRHRLFATSFASLVPPCNHSSQPIIHGVYGHGQSKAGRLHRWIKGLPAATVADWRQAMDIDWMTRDELAQAIPPAYTEYLGRQFLDQLARQPQEGL
jgi:DNA (cytosine-5)-methyltransferase 1